MEKYYKKLSGFSSTSLEGLEVVKLLKRYDTKFIFHRNRLALVLDFLSGYYEILEIDNRRSFRYTSTYFDSPDLIFYHQHHNRCYDRYKIRSRKYIDSNQCYFEIKQKNNRKKTIKNRLSLNGDFSGGELPGELKSFALDNISFASKSFIDNLRPSLIVEFERLTFADRYSGERLTLDINLSFTGKDSSTGKMHNLVVAEIKRENRTLNQRFLRFLKTMAINPTKFSKYCLGLVMTENNLKYNRFKKYILKINKLN
ncbi:MAG: polyphosphate polymerase domain-containing protein [Deltaproteobacteria bacterium]|nr:polyphosphate polymerase domain-containing protein [Deltaproteobacteria bacterium]